MCKDWKLQISTPLFIHKQSVSFSSVSGFFLQSPKSPPSFISIDPIAYGVADQELKFLPEPVDLKSSSNGLLCCQGRTADKPYYVCNPVNQQWKKLPKPTADHGSDPAIVLVFEPSLLNFVADYKVVCIFASNDIEEAYEFEIYSSLQDSWKVCSEMFFSTMTKQLKFTRGIAVSGVIYWHLGSGKTLMFDLKKEKVMDYGYGRYIVGITYASSLEMIDGKLCKSSIRDNLSITLDVLHTIHANTMSMRSTNSPWLPKHHIQLNVKDLQCQRNNLQLLMTWDNVILLRVGAKVFCYDIRTHTTRLCAQVHFHSQYQVFPYVNNLVSLI